MSRFFDNPLVYLAGFVAFTLFVSTYHPQSWLGPMHKVVVEYHIDYEWAYTGTSDSYQRHDGQQVFNVAANDPDVFRPSDFVPSGGNTQAAGLPVHTWTPMGTAIPVTLYNGTKCTFRLGLRDGGMDCPNGAEQTRTIRGMKTKVFRDSAGHYQVYASPAGGGWTYGI